VHAFRPALNAMVADLVDETHRPRAYGLLYWAINLGMALSLVAGGLIARYGYTRLFLADAATTLLFAALVWRRVPETLAPRAARAGATAAPRGYGAVVRDRGFLAFLAVNLAFIVVFWQFQVTLPLDMARHGFGPAPFGRVLAVNGFVIAFLQPWSTLVTARVSARRVLALASILVGVGYGSYAFCTTEREWALATAVWTVGEILALPVASAVVAEMSPADLRGRYQGAFGLCFGVGMLAAPMIGCALLDAFGSRALWLGCFGLSLGESIAHLLVRGAKSSEAWTRSRAT
jgi:predicted MFS family arabinose efflux permease